MVMPSKHSASLRAAKRGAGDSRATFAPTYDDDGNMLAAHGWTLTWDAENRLVSAVNGTARLEFVYDAYSRRREKKVYASDILTKHEKYLYNGYKMIAVFDALDEDARIMTFLWQPVELDIPLCMTYNNETYYYLADGNKNITGLFDSTGARVATYTYAPFGELLSSSGTMASVNPFRFSSELYDAETSLVYYNYRYYSPVLGRWLSRDPVEEKGGWNLYVLIDNQITGKNDAKGLNPAVLVTGWGIAAFEPTPIGEVVMLLATGIWLLSRSRAHSDPYVLPRVEPGFNGCKCRPCPPNSPKWTHVHADGTKNTHQIVYHQLPYPLCTCIPKRIHL